MHVLIIGSGGREHALAWKVAQSANVHKVFVAPGNAGTALEKKVQNVAIDSLDIPGLMQFANDHRVQLTIVGPEAPLAAGIVDAFTHANLACLGPKQACAQLEASKAYSKQFMQRYHIPTAYFATFDDATAAKRYVKKHGVPIVIKADGLAAGKGVVIAQTIDEANTAIDNMLEHHQFGQASKHIVIEEFLQGVEASFIVLCDGINFLPLATSQDHKRLLDHDQGPNTGGMGAYSPAKIISVDLHARILQAVIEPTLRGMAEQGTPYTGFLYAGLMITPKNEIKVLEFNCRLGDPETQVILPRMQSDLVTLCLAAINQQLSYVTCSWDPRPALGVVAVAEGYPEKYRKGDVITGLDQDFDADVKIFHAATGFHDDQVVTQGGRVLCATALGDTFKLAQNKAYAALQNIHWQGRFYRKDIGYQVLQKSAKKS